MVALLIQIDAYDPVGAAAVTLRIASDNDDSLCHLNSQTWWPALQTAPVFSYDYFDGSFAGGIETPSSSIVVSTDPWPNFARYSFGDARVQIWTGTLGAAWGTYTLRFDGQVTAQPEISQGLATIAIKVDDRWLDTPLLTPLLGTGGVEGPAEMLGTPRPLMLGRPRYAPGLMVDSVNNVLMLSGYGLIEDVEFAMEALARFGASTGDYASYAALIAATIPPGGWGTCKASGLVRHGAPPAGKLSYMVKGDKAGPDGWARLPGQLIRRIALLAGGTGRIADASLNALDAARPYNVSLVVTEQTTARDLIQRIAASVNAVAGISWTGNLWARPVGIGSSARTLASDGSSLPPVARVDQIAVSAPFWRVAIEAENTWAVHAQNEVFYIEPAPGGADAAEKNATSGNNRIYNGDGEQGRAQINPLGWGTSEATAGCFVQSFDVAPKSGKRSIALGKTAAGVGTVFASGLAIPVKPGQTYLIKASIIGDTARASGLYIRMQEKSAAPSSGIVDITNRTSATDLLSNAPVATSYVDYTYNYTVPAGIYFVSPAIGNYTGGPQYLHFDDYQMFEQTPGTQRTNPVTGTVLPTMIDDEGRPLTKIAFSGAARDGDVVSFPATLPNIPQIVFLPGGNGATAGQNIVIQPIGLSATGFTMKAKSQAVTAGSTITDTTETAGGGGNPDKMINRSNGGHPYDNKFRFKYDVTVGEIAPGEPGRIVVTAYAKISAAWVAVGSKSHSSTGSYYIDATLASADFGAGDEFGISMTTAEGVGTVISDFVSVVYVQGTVTETSLTPAGASDIPWLALI